MKSIINFIHKRILQLILTLFYFFGFIFFLIAYFNEFIYHSKSILLFVLYMILYLLPFIVNLIILILDYKNKIKHKIGNILSIILIPINFIYVIIITFIFGILISMNPVTDYSYYNDLYNSNIYIKDFPKSVPNDAKNIKFYYQPGILQGITTMNLYYEINNKTMKEYIKKYELKSIKIISIGDNNNFDNNSSIRLENIKINGDYNIYYLYDKEDKLSFVAINEKENKCIFVYENW